MQKLSDMKDYWMGALQPSLLKRSIFISMTVGTVLTIVNQGEYLANLQINTVQLIFTYIVPFCVSITSGRIAQVSCNKKLKLVNKDSHATE